MKAKVRKTIIIALIVIVLALFSTVGVRQYQTNYKKTVVSSSAYGDYSVRIYMIGTPVFPYGETYCRVDLLKNGRRVNQQSLALHNDGAAVTADNFVVEWDDEYVRVVAYAAEQDELEVTLAL